jgi:hypothetical protein
MADAMTSMVGQGERGDLARALVLVFDPLEPRP